MLRPTLRRPSLRLRRLLTHSVRLELLAHHEMFSGAALEIVPSSISSLHYPYLLRLRLRESLVADDESVNFRFFSPGEIESAPGGSTLENPADPVDYNTAWEPYECACGADPCGCGDSQSLESALRRYSSLLLHTEPEPGDAVTQSQRYYLAEQDIVIGIAGYKSSRWRRAAYALVCALSLGLGYIVLRWLPRLRVALMGTRCALGAADWCIVENEYGELAVCHVQRLRFDEPLSHFLVADDKRNPVVPTLCFFEYRYLRFFYDPVDDLFRTNSQWIDPRWLQKKTDGVSSGTQEQRAAIFGANTIRIHQRPVALLLVDEVLHPFYVFQLFLVALWLADDYYYYAACILVISVALVARSLVETRATIRRLAEMTQHGCDVRVWRSEFWKLVPSSELVPGDVFEVEPQIAVLPCDALLVHGECVVNEAMLTGESVPVTKAEATHETVAHLQSDFTHPHLAKLVLYCGTRLLRCRADGPVLAMALRTGFNTTKGSLVRSMLFPKPTGFKLYRDSFRYIGFMALVACAGFVYSTYNFVRLGVATRLIVLRALDLVTIVVPPALPATLTIGISFAVNRLRAKRIYCTAPSRINIAGRVDVMCFDKTGTLTEDGLDVLGVHSLRSAAGRKEMVFLPLALSVLQLASPSEGRAVDTLALLTACMALCHLLRQIDELVGDPLDLKMFDFTNWTLFDEPPGVASDTEKLGIVREYEFVAALRRMSVVVSRGLDLAVYTKGAPEVIAAICDPLTLPASFHELLHTYTHGGFRVIACASKSVRTVPSREHAEQNLEFLGFIVFENKLKPTTGKTLAQLHGAAVRTLMCTGDNVLTAVSVGRECGLVLGPVYAARFAEPGEDTGGTGVVWEDLETLRRLDILGEQGTLAITGDVFRYLLVELQHEPLTTAMLLQTLVFARMSPDEKHGLVEQLQKLDYTVGFCGDGANDCGALKAADLGVSLSEAEASVAAPFTLQLFEISCVLDVIREGRCALVTSFACFKYMLLYLAIQFVTVSLLYRGGTNLGDFQFLYIDMFLILPLAVVMLWGGPADKLSKKKPTADLVSPKVLVPLCGHIALIVFFQLYAHLWAKRQPWYVPAVPSDDENVKLSDNSVLFLFANFQYIANALLLSTGAPFRAPITKNKPLLVNLVVATLLSMLLFAIDGRLWLGNLMQLTDVRGGFLVSLAAMYLFSVLLGDGVFLRVAKLRRKRGSKKRFKRARETGV